MAEGSGEVKKTGGGLKIAIGAVIVAVVLGYLIFRIINFVTPPSPTKYEQTLASFFRDAAKGNASSSKSAAEGIRNELALIRLAPGRYQLYSFDFQTLPATNAADPTARIVFSIETEERGRKEALLCEALFLEYQGNARISQIHKLFQGRNITQR